jgi:hypothetical protein
MTDDFMAEQEALLARMTEELNTPIPRVTVRPVTSGEALDPAEGDVDSPDEFNRSVEDEDV